MSVLICAILFLTSSYGCTSGGDDTAQRSLYESGVDAYNKGDFAEAKRFFTESGMYGDSETYMESIEKYESLYIEGVNSVAACDYRKAYSDFSAIRTFLNSREYIEYIDSLEQQYEAGRILYEQGQFFAARTCFVAANGYDSSADYIANIDAMTALYNKGMALFNAGSYTDAIAAFRGINTDFADSALLIDEAVSRLNYSKITLNAYIKNYNELAAGTARMDAGSIDTEFTLRDSRGVLFSGVTDENGCITRIAFGFSSAVREQLGETGMTDALCLCINALNPYVADSDDIRDGLYAYLSRSGAGYGSMWIRAAEGAAGALVVEAVHFSSGTH